MKTYIGVKVIEAWPQTEKEAFPDSDREDRPGYGVKYDNGRYTSWSPRAVFEEAYREVPDEDAESILLGARAEIERLANGGALFDVIESDDDARRQRDVRHVSLHLSYRTFSINGAASFNMRDVFNRASQIAAYINDGVVSIPQDEASG